VKIPWGLIEKFNNGEKLDTREIKKLFEAYPAMLKILGIDVVSTASVIRLLYTKRMLSLREQFLVFSVIWKIEHWLETEDETNQRIWRDAFVDKKEYWQIAVERLKKPRPVTQPDKDSYERLIWKRLRRMIERFKKYLTERVFLCKNMI